MTPAPAPPRRAPIARWLYLALAVAGLILPARRYYTWFAENGLSGEALYAAVTQNLIAMGMIGTVFVTTTATVIFIFTECLARRDGLAAICIPITCFLGVGVGLPFYLFLRQRRRT
ncbi:DUF2834 domain-containing protein [Rhodobacteraceae bacterium NNCM2]|nr:DUF2834 domain-containing protein [Coraliihabitans acroporae]